MRTPKSDTRTYHHGACLKCGTLATWFGHYNDRPACEACGWRLNWWQRWRRHRQCEAKTPKGRVPYQRDREMGKHIKKTRLAHKLSVSAVAMACRCEEHEVLQAEKGFATENLHTIVEYVCNH